MITEKYLNKLFSESLYISDKSIVVDFYDFKNGNKSLLIIGLSGSGKSSISKLISKNIM